MRVHEILSRQSPNQTGGEDKTLPRPCGQFWMIRRCTSAQFVPANAGAKAKNPVGSTLFSTPMAQPVRHGRQVTGTLPPASNCPEGATFSQPGLRKSVVSYELTRDKTCEESCGRGGG